MEKRTVYFYVGSYTRPYARFQARGAGVYLCALSLPTGQLRLVDVRRGITNPAYLALDAAQEHLYAVQETPLRQAPAVYTYRIDPKNKHLTLLQRQPVQGGLPCHLSLDGTGKWIAVANYGTGSVQLFPVQEGGLLGRACAFKLHRGRSSDPVRQREPHPHAVVFSPDNRHLLVPDLGLDKVASYQLDIATGRLTDDRGWTAFSSGSGPRHLAFHPNGSYAFVLAELSSRLTVMTYEGVLRPLSSISTLPAGDRDRRSNTAAAVKVSACGRFVYVSNRGHDSITVFEFDSMKRMLRSVQHLPSGGQKPRDLALDPTGRLLLAANHNSDAITSFYLDAQTGRLVPTGHRLAVPTPACVAFLK